MNSYTVIGKSELGNPIASFKLNKPLNVNVSEKFNNIDEAQNTHIVQKLFYLPFVKSVTLNNQSIEIERFNILEWDEVLKEVSDQIEEFLNSADIMDNYNSNKKTIPISIYAESTPNPEVMKFVANKRIVSSTFEFKNIDQAKDSPLAQKLFHYPYVKEIFMDYNYISITKYEISKWDLKPTLLKDRKCWKQH